MIQHKVTSLAVSNYFFANPNYEKKKNSYFPMKIILSNMFLKLIYKTAKSIQNGAEIYFILQSILSMKLPFFFFP